MQNYTEEEAAILCGFIGRYVDRDSTYDTVRSGYSTDVTRPARSESWK